MGCLQLVAHRILIVAGTEYSLFQAFSGWLRHEIDTQAAESSASETSEREANIDYASTLDYVQGAMMHSQLVHLFGLENLQDGTSRWDLAAEGTSLFELYKREYEDDGRGLTSTKQLPGLDSIISYLRTRWESVFTEIADTQRRNVRLGAPVPLEHGGSTIMDMRTLVEVMNHQYRCLSVVLK